MSSYKVDRTRWATMTIFEQMGNIYSEVGRSMSAKKARNAERCEQAPIRAIELFDATVEVLVAQHSPKAREVLRAKEQYLAAMQDDGVAEADRISLDRYFLHFALVARAGR